MKRYPNPLAVERNGVVADIEAAQKLLRNISEDQINRLFSVDLATGDILARDAVKGLNNTLYSLNRVKLMLENIKYND